MNHAALLCHSVFLLENWPETVLRKSRFLTEVWHWESGGCAPLGELIEKEVSFSLNSTKQLYVLRYNLTQQHSAWLISSKTHRWDPHMALQRPDSLSDHLSDSSPSHTIQSFCFRKKRTKNEKGVKSIIAPGITILLDNIKPSFA